MRILNSPFLILAEMLSLLALASTNEIVNIWLILPISLTLVRFGLEKFFQKNNWGLSEKLIFPLLVLLIPFSYFLGKSTGWHPVVVSAHIVLITQSLLFLQIQSPRVEGFRSALVFVYVLLSGSLSPEFHTGIFILLVLMCSILHFLRNTLSEYQNPGLRLKPSFLFLTQTSILAVILVFSFIFFPLIPRSKFAAMFGGSGFGLGSQASTVGFSGDLGLLPNQRWEEANPKVEIRIYLPSEQPRQAFEYFFNKGLIPMRTLELFDGTSWLSRSGGQTHQNIKIEDLSDISPQSDIWAEIIREPHSRENIPSPRNPSEIVSLWGAQGTNADILKFNIESQDIWLAQSQRKRIKVIYSKITNPADEAKFFIAPNPSPKIGKSLRSTPPSFKNDPDIQNLISQFSKNETPPEGVRKSISSFFGSNNFTWALASQESNLKGIPLLKYFLFDSRKGHCELYATAAALFFREMNIPARIVTGYRTQFEGSPLVIVYDRDAHAWVEFWNGKNWEAFDPTPPAPFSLSRDSVWGWISQQFVSLENNLSSAWYRQIVGFDPASDKQNYFNWSDSLGSYFRRQNFKSSNDDSDSSPQPKSQNGSWIVFVLIGFGLFPLIFFFVSRERKKNSLNLESFEPLGLKSLVFWFWKAKIKFFLKKEKASSLKELKIRSRSRPELLDFIKTYENYRFGPKDKN